MWKPWVNMFCGFWLFLSGIPGIELPANPFFLGGVLFVVGLWSLKWPGIVIALIGGWTVVTAYFGFMQESFMFIIVGLLVAVFSLIQMAVN